LWRPRWPFRGFRTCQNAWGSSRGFLVPCNCYGEKGAHLAAIPLLGSPVPRLRRRGLVVPILSSPCFCPFPFPTFPLLSLRSSYLWAVALAVPVVLFCRCRQWLLAPAIHPTSSSESGFVHCCGLLGSSWVVKKHKYVSTEKEKNILQVVQKVRHQTLGTA